jgi:hypothetical protein
MQENSSNLQQINDTPVIKTIVHFVLETREVLKLI